MTKIFIASSNHPPLSEPEIVNCLFMTGINVQSGDGFVRVVGWVDLPMIGHNDAEHRIVGRFVMPTESARTLLRELRKALGSQ